MGRVRNTLGGHGVPYVVEPLPHRVRGGTNRGRTRLDGDRTGYTLLMPVYVDDVRHAYGRMIMCHMFADTEEELFAMADKIGVARKWIQQPPKASWAHFDISIGMKEKALVAGAILTDKYGPLMHLARARGDRAAMRRIWRIRQGATQSYYQRKREQEE